MGGGGTGDDKGCIAMGKQINLPKENVMYVGLVEPAWFTELMACYGENKRVFIKRQ